MTVSGSSRGYRTAGSAGTILIEVMVAVLLTGVLVGELATALMSAMDRAVRVDTQVPLAGLATVSESRESWSWGPSVASFSWGAGPVLRVSCRPCDHAGLMVAGLWADGWFLGERELDTDASLALGRATWEGMQGRELVLRVRETAGEWGPPWRTVVPDVYGEIVGEEAVPLPAAGEAAALSGQANAVHVPSLATPTLESSWAVSPQEAVGLGAPLFLLPSTVGLGDMAVSGDPQTWSREAGRAVDLYF
jgi:hypothetical protein